MGEQEPLRWSTDEVSKQQQFDKFRQTHRESNGRWRLTRSAQEGFRATLNLVQVHDFKIYRASTDPLTALRCQYDIDRDKQDFFGLTYMQSGSCTLRQGQNESYVHANQIAIWDSSRPAVTQFNQPITQFCVHIPRVPALALVPGIEDLGGLAIEGASSAGQVLVAHLMQLENNILTIPTQLRGSILEATLMLIGAVFRPSEKSLEQAVRRPALLRVQDYIRKHLSDCDLSVSGIAEALGYSPRHIHRLFADFDFSASDWIKARRLQAARIALASIPASSISIAQISEQCGFRDQSYFSRAFKAEFGVSPLQFRKTSFATELN